MPTVVVAILDRDTWKSNTDIVVVADDLRNRLTWIPRDLWVPSIRHRINTAFSLGDGERLLACLREVGFACDAALCLRRGATERALAEASVVVPVSEWMDFWYPLQPTAPIEDGRKQISFVPPEETLSGERIHQWLGARLTVHRHGYGSDRHRCGRQQVFLRALMTQGFDFRAVLADRRRVSVTGDPMAVLAKVRPDWTMETFWNVRDAVIDGKQVLVQLGLRARIGAALSRWRGRPPPAPGKPPAA